MALISASLTLTSPSHRQQVPQRWQQWMMGVSAELSVMRMVWSWLEADDAMTIKCDDKMTKVWRGNAVPEGFRGR